MTKQELQQIIEDLNQLANNDKSNYTSKDILDAIHDDNFKTGALDLLICNNIPYTLCAISKEIIHLVFRIYMLEDYIAYEEEYLHKTLRALDGFKPELQRIQEYTTLLKQANALENSSAKYKEGLLEGVRVYDYKCSLDNIELL